MCGLCMIVALFGLYAVHDCFYRESCHIDKLSVKCCRILGILNRLKRILPLNIKIILYNSLMLPHLNYGITLWGLQM